MLTISMAGCISDSTVEQISDEITEVLGCMEESALNYDESATTSSDLCLSEEQLLLAEEVFWSSWDSDAVNNAAEPVGYRLMLEEKSEGGNTSGMLTRDVETDDWGRTLDVQEVFAPDYYDQEFEYRSGNDGGFNLTILNSRQTVFDNVVQVEKYSGIVDNNTMYDYWDNYSMSTASTYEEFRNRLEHGPGIRSSSDWTNNTMYNSDTAARSDDRSGEDDSQDTIARSTVTPTDMRNKAILIDAPWTGAGEDTSWLESVDFHEVETRGNGRSQTIYYFARDTSTGNEIEVMGEMTENGFKITEYCNEIHNTNLSIIESFTDGEPIYSRNDKKWDINNNTNSARIILLEVDGNDMRFEEYDYDEPVNHRWSNNNTIYDSTHLPFLPFRAIPFYFEVIPDSDANETQNKSAEGRKGLNAVNVKVVIAGPSGPFGMEGDLSDYRLVISNCTLDNKTLGSSNNNTMYDATTAARSGGNNSNNSWLGDRAIYGSDGNSCTDLIEYDLASGVHLNGTKIMVNRSQGGGPSIIFVDADSSGTLSEGDRFEFSDNNTIFDGANMVRLYSISADGYSDENINPSSELSSVHQGAMSCIRNIRSVAPDDPPPPATSVYKEVVKFMR